MKIAITTGPDGAALFAGDVLFSAETYLYQCAQSGHFGNGAEVDVVGGPQLLGGAVLTWDAPRAGCAATATVVANDEVAALAA